MDSALFKDKNEIKPSETTKDDKKRKIKKNQNHNIIFKESLLYHNTVLVMILTRLKKSL